MQPIYTEDEIVDPRERAAAYDTSGVPIPPSVDGFQMLGQVQGTSTNNAYLAEQYAEERLRMSEKQRADAEQAAIRFAGQRKYRSLIEGGARPEEALRLAGPELFWNNPAALVSSVRASREVTPFEPSVREVNGIKFGMTGPNRAQVIQPSKVVMPPDVAMNQKLLMEQLKRKTTGPLAIAADPKEIANLERQLLEGSTNWNNKASAPAAKVLTRELAADFKAQAKGDKDLARKLAREAGYTF